MATNHTKSDIHGNYSHDVVIGNRSHDVTFKDGRAPSGLRHLTTCALCQRRSQDLSKYGLPYQRHSFVQHRVRELEVWRAPSLRESWNQHRNCRQSKGGRVIICGTAPSVRPARYRLLVKSLPQNTTQAYQNRFETAPSSNVSGASICCARKNT